jgi:transposase
MQTVTTVGFDIAKSVFQVHGVDAAGPVLVRPAVEAPPCTCVLPKVATISGWH